LWSRWGCCPCSGRPENRSRKNRRARPAKKPCAAAAQRQAIDDRPACRPLAALTATFQKVKKMEKLFDGTRNAKLGTAKNPAVVHVQTAERETELAAIFKKNGWEYQIKLEPDQPEDISDLEILLNPLKTKIAEKKAGRNDPCPCGSGKKYKKCCGQ
jgi:SWIM/SEC-C metal-binding protein